MSPVPPNDSDIPQWIHEETVSPQVTVWSGECESWGRGINIPMVCQPLFTGVREAMEANSRLPMVFVSERKRLQNGDGLKAWP